MLLLTVLLVVATAVAPVLLLMLMMHLALTEHAEESVRPAPVPRRVRTFSDMLLWHSLMDWMRTKPLRLTDQRE
jgi:hypothetical protein